MIRVCQSRRCVLVVLMVLVILFGTRYLKWTEKLYLTTSQSTTPMPYALSMHLKLSENRNMIRSQPKAQIFHRSPFGWERWAGFCNGDLLFDKAILKTPAGLIPIYIHNIVHDEWVSRSIKEKGVWEEKLVELVHHFLSKDEDLHLIDIGSHIGEFSLMGAKMGRQVIAVDPLYENIQRLCKSIEVNNFGQLINVFYTALSDTRAKVSFNRHFSNIGGTQINKKEGGIGYNTSNGTVVKVVSPPLLTLYDKNTIDTILLDDLLPFVSFDKVFMKIDVESHENYVLKGGEKFFNSIDIRYVLMEWVAHSKSSSSGRQIITFLTSRGFAPYVPNIQKHKFMENNGYGDILWIKS